jgi:hypothetical protein
MPLVLVGTCRKCGEPVVVRSYESDVYTVEIPDSRRKANAVCTKCGTMNQYSDAELKQEIADVRVLPEKPPTDRQ